MCGSFSPLHQAVFLTSFHTTDERDGLNILNHQSRGVFSFVTEAEYRIGFEIRLELDLNPSSDMLLNTAHIT